MKIFSGFRKDRLLFLICLIIFTANLYSGTANALTLMAERTGEFEKRKYQSLTGFAAFDYYLLKPANYDPNKKYPLVLTLHGASGHSYAAYALASENYKQEFPAFVLVPHIKSLGWTLPKYTDFKPAPSEHIMVLIERLKKEFPIDANRIYITGYSTGGYGTFEMAAEYHDKFAAAVPLCGGGAPSLATKLANVPMWVFHGALDNGIKPENSRRMVRAIKQAGGRPNYIEYPDLGHNIWERTYNNPLFWKWLFAQNLQKR